MKKIFDDVSFKCSEITTKKYSTSFSLGIKLLEKNIQKHIYSIYGFVRFADEIVDSFHTYPKQELLDSFIIETEKAIQNKISLNPILNSFQHTVNEYNIDKKLIDTFIQSMQMDLDRIEYDQENYDKYILGSAEVVGLMCLKVFVVGDESKYRKLKPYAMKLGSVFQKVNFLRDINFDLTQLQRSYFPNIKTNRLTDLDLIEIYKEIDNEFKFAYNGVIFLPNSSRFGVYLAYRYYNKLYKKIKNCTLQKIMNERIRIPEIYKFSIFLRSFIRYQLKMY